MARLNWMDRTGRICGSSDEKGDMENPFSLELVWKKADSSSLSYSKLDIFIYLILEEGVAYFSAPKTCRLFLSDNKKMYFNYFDGMSPSSDGDFRRVEVARATRVVAEKIIDFELFFDLNINYDGEYIGTLELDGTIDTNVSGGTIKTKRVKRKPNIDSFKEKTSISLHHTGLNTSKENVWEFNPDMTEKTMVVNKTAKYFSTGESMPEKIKGKRFTISDTKGNSALLKEIDCWVDAKDLSRPEARTVEARLYSGIDYSDVKKKNTTTRININGVDIDICIDEDSLEGWDDY